MMDREWIDNVKIEHRGEDGGMNITMFVRLPATGNYRLPTYGELVLTAESVFRDAMKADSGKFAPTYADVMAWSDTRHRSLDVPHSYRVSLDLCPPGKTDASEWSK